MEMVVDVSGVLAVVLNEAHREEIVRKTEGADLVAPPSFPWEFGNALSGMFKRHRLTLGDARGAIRAYREIPILYSDVELEDAVELASELGIYAYDAYMIRCAQEHKCRLLTLDTGLAAAAAKAGVSVVEIGT